jgi:RNA polymerase sigma-70 factor (ECF subfamily)
MEALINELINLYKPITRVCCRSYRLPEDSVEDVMHDTFLAAYRNISTCRERARLGSWLRTIAQNQAINLIRKQSMSKRQKVANSLHESYISSQNPEILAQSQELHRNLHAGIEALPHTWRTIVILFYWHQKNTYEIAMRMQIRPDTIRNILHKSRKRLRQELEGMYVA